MARPRKGQELNASLSVRCNRKLIDDLNRLASISGLSTNEFARAVLENAVEKEVIVLETFEDQEERFAAWDREKKGFPPFKKLTALFGSQVMTRAENQARMRAAIEKGDKLSE